MSASLEIALEIALLRKAGNLPLTKRISLGPDGSSLVSHSNACFMSRGFARRFRFANLVELAEVIESFGPDEALALGSLRPDLPARVEVVAKHQLNASSRPDLIARTKDFFVYRRGEPALALIDFDQKGMPDSVAEAIRRCGGPWEALTSVLPALAKIARIERRSTSSGVYRADTGQKLEGSGGLHIFLPLEDGEDCERFLKTLHEWTQEASKLEEWEDRHGR
jgi:hypothetical protein